MSWYRSSKMAEELALVGLKPEEIDELANKIDKSVNASGLSLNQLDNILNPLSYFKHELQMIAAQLEARYKKNDYVLFKKHFEELSKVHSKPSGDTIQSFVMSDPSYDEQVQKLRARWLIASKWSGVVSDIFWIVKSTKDTVGVKNG